MVVPDVERLMWATTRECRDIAAGRTSMISTGSSNAVWRAGDVCGTVPSPLDLMDGAMRVYDQIVRGEQGGLPVRRLPEGLRVG
jgi:hypothetical protein